VLRPDRPQPSECANPTVTPQTNNNFTARPPPTRTNLQTFPCSPFLPLLLGLTCLRSANMTSHVSFSYITTAAQLPSLFVGIVAWFISVVGCRCFFHPLAKVPGPPLAALTYLYIFCFNVGKTSRLYAHIEKLHKRYGM